MYKMKIIKYIFLNLCLFFTFYVNAHASFEIGISLDYANLKVIEDNQNNVPAFYFVNNTKSSRHGVGVGMFFYKAFSFKKVTLAAGPSTFLGKLILDDEQPVGLIAEGDFLIRFGMDFKVLITAIRFLKPYIKIGAGGGWSSIDWKTNITYSYFPNNISFQERTFGLIYYASLGLEFKLNQTYFIFVEGAFVGGKFNSEIEGNYSIIPDGNRYKQLGFEISAGCNFKFNPRRKRKYRKGRRRR